MYDCIVVGAGPAGSLTAQKLSEMGFSILIVEEHENVGIPAHCAGIVGEKVIKELNPPSHIILKRVETVRVHFPSGKNIILPTPIKPFVVDRPLLDQWLFQKAVESGADYIISGKVELVERQSHSVRIHVKNGKTSSIIEGKICVIAVGAMSSLPGETGFQIPRQSYQTVQADVRIKNVCGIELFLGNHIAPGSFAYVVSLNGVKGKAGLIVRNDAGRFFENFIQSDLLKEKIVDLESSPRFRRMPFGVIKRAVEGRVLAVGDAASQLKTTTGGGVYYGTQCSSILAKVIKSARQNGDFDDSALLEYDHKWRKEIVKELIGGLALRNFLEKMDDNWWNMIAELLNTAEARELIENYRDFDRHYGFISNFFRLLGNGKSLLRLAGKKLFSAGNGKN